MAQAQAQVQVQAQAQAQIQQQKLALFFDNESKNFTNSIDLLQNKCHNIIPILINGITNHSDLVQKPVVEANIINFFQPNILVDTQETLDNYLKIGLQWPILFDNTSGITIAQLTNLITLFNDATFSDNFSHIVIDFDRTFTMVEGLAHIPNIQTFITALKYPDPQPTPLEFVTFMMGGITRKDLIVQFISLLQNQGKQIIILTNNRAPISTPFLIPDFLNTIGLKDIDIISTHSHPGLKKYGVMDTYKNMCQTFGDQAILDTIKDNLISNGIDIYREWILPSFAPLPTQMHPMQPGGANKRHNKKTKKSTKSL